MAERSRHKKKIDSQKDTEGGKKTGSGRRTENMRTLFVSQRMVKGATAEGRVELNVSVEGSLEERMTKGRRGGALPLEWESEEVQGPPRQRCVDCEEALSWREVCQNDFDQAWCQLAIDMAEELLRFLVSA